MQDHGGPLVILHFNGHAWSQAATSDSVGSLAQPGYGVPGQLAPDGQGGLWIPIPIGIAFGGAGYLVHYSGGQLTAAALLSCRPTRRPADLPYSSNSVTLMTSRSAKS
ncbi:MAG: hypothetical protein ACRDNZ_10955 [Streptosporangiaceae bacterium]